MGDATNMMKCSDLKVSGDCSTAGLPSDASSLGFGSFRGGCTDKDLFSYTGPFSKAVQQAVYTGSSCTNNTVSYKIFFNTGSCTSVSSTLAQSGQAAGLARCDNNKPELLSCLNTQSCSDASKCTNSVPNVTDTTCTGTGMFRTGYTCVTGGAFANVVVSKLTVLFGMSLALFVTFAV
ncbi:hypothetical protein HK102_005571 [Quaeritorhiza haematococci]|nr:hypothetical protein HK102_005571 [Quaeritorhiza haematococci]